MLNWSTLTLRQRSCGVLLASIFMLGVFAEYQRAYSLRDWVSAAAMCLVGAGAILNPAFYRPAQNKLADFPRACIWLTFGGILLGVISTTLLSS
jgi:di/tricarboxylate transporter